MMNKNELLDRLRSIYDSCSHTDTKKQILDLIIDIGKSYDNNFRDLGITWDSKGSNGGPGVGPHTGTIPFNGYNTISNFNEPEKGGGGFKLSDVFPNLYAKKGNNISEEDIKKLSDESYKSPLIKKANDSNNTSYAFKDDDGTKGLHTQK